jgi:hypothetical protein
MIRTACSSFASRGIIVCAAPESFSSRGTNADKSTIVFSGSTMASFRFGAKVIEFGICLSVYQLKMENTPPARKTTVLVSSSRD